MKRATQYRYSLFDSSFKSPGRDNTLGSGIAAQVREFNLDLEFVLATGETQAGSRIADL